MCIFYTAFFAILPNLLQIIFKCLPDSLGCLTPFDEGGQYQEQSPWIIIIISKKPHLEARRMVVAA